MIRDGVPSDQNNVGNFWMRMTIDRLGSFWKLWAAMGAWMAAHAIAR